MDYITKVLTQVKEKNADQPEFIQAVEEVLESLKPVIEAHPEYEKQAIVSFCFFALFIHVWSCTC